jgi:hypothetical protein
MPSNQIRIMPLILASGPQMEGLVPLLFLAALLCVILPVVFFIYGIVQFWHERSTPGLAAFAITILFLLPFLEMGKSAPAFMIIFFIVLPLSVLICFLFIIRAKK